jgi:hypothetical protein
MNEIEVIQNVPLHLFGPDGNTPPTKLLVRDQTVSVLPDQYRTNADDRVYDYSKINGAISLVPVDTSSYEAEFTTAEGWLILKGYGPMQLVGLLDMESRLAAAAKSSPKMAAVRSWIDAITAAFLQSPTARNDWPEPPHSFQHTLIEASAALSQ